MITGIKDTMQGVVLLNKPKHLSSNQCLQRFKRKFGLPKVGHTGSLDPVATGMLPICIGEATKFSQYLLDANKGYQATGMLGITTDSLDCEGRTKAVTPLGQVTAEDVITACATFEGDYSQIPPMFSALKQQGQRLYTLARQGREVTRPPRDVQILLLKVASVTLPYFTIEVHCSKGTYIRSLIDDIGRLLGVGAHVVQLHRTFVAPFQTKETVELAEIDTAEALNAVLHPIDCMLQHLPSVRLNPEEALLLAQGRILADHGAPLGEIDGLLHRAYTSDRFIGLVKVYADGAIKAKRLCADLNRELLKDGRINL